MGVARGPERGREITLDMEHNTVSEGVGGAYSFKSSVFWRDPLSNAGYIVDEAVVACLHE